jgi:hypothetical protein
VQPADVGLAGQIAAEGAAKLARGISAVGDALTQRAQQIKDEDDKMAALRVTAQGRQKLNGLLYDEQAGFLSQRGEAALGLPERSGKALEELKTEVLGQAKNKAQRATIEQMFTGDLLAADETVLRHYATQRQAMKEDALEQSLTAIQSAAVLNAGNGRMQEGYSQSLRQAVEAAFGDQGAAVVANKYQAAQSKMNYTVFGELLRRVPLDGPETARAFLASREKMFPAEQLAQARQNLKEAGDAFEVKAGVDALFAEREELALESAEPGDGGVVTGEAAGKDQPKEPGAFVSTFRSPSGVIAAVREAFKGKDKGVIEQAVEYAKSKLAEQEKDYNANVQAAYDSIIEGIDGGTYTTMAQVQSVVRAARVPAPGAPTVDVLAEPLDNDVRDKLLAYAARKLGVNQHYPEFRSQSDLSALDELRRLKHVGTTGKFRMLEQYPTVDAFKNAYRGRLSVDDFFSAVKDYEDLEHFEVKKKAGDGNATDSVLKLKPSWSSLVDQRTDRYVKDHKMSADDEVRFRVEVQEMFKGMVGNYLLANPGKSDLTDAEVAEFLLLAFQEVPVKKFAGASLGWGQNWLTDKMARDTSMPLVDVFYGGMDSFEVDRKAGLYRWRDASGKRWYLKIGSNEPPQMEPAK